MGLTDVEFVPSTFPTPLMLKLVGAPPDRVQASVEDPPEVIELGVAVKELITGAVTGGASGVPGYVLAATSAPLLTPSPSESRAARAAVMGIGRPAVRQSAPNGLRDDELPSGVVWQSPQLYDVP